MGEASVVAIVDDDQSVRMALASLLRSAGFVVLLYASAEEFLGGRPVPSIACLILDSKMPGMDGLELQTRLREEGWLVPTIFLTAHGDDRGRAQALAGGAMAFLPKPFDADVLLRAVKSAFH
jgi:FixJ family two-component response regulator